MADATVLQQIGLDAHQQRVVVMRRYNLRMQRHQFLFANLLDVKVIYIAHLPYVQALVF